MGKLVTLRDFQNNKRVIDIPNWEAVAHLLVEVVSGDEILTVEYIDGKIKEYDSSSCRMLGLRDGSYELNLWDIDEFSSGESSYDNLKRFKKRWIDK